LPDAHDADPERARIAAFMTEKVTPQMAELLGVKSFDPRTGQGFSCFNCHPAEP